MSEYLTENNIANQGLTIGISVDGNGNERKNSRIARANSRLLINAE